MSNSPKPPTRTVLAGMLSSVLEWLVCLVIIFLCVGSPPPGINESHYIPKAKSVWDPSFASGNDLFLQSHDSHFLASLFAGQLAKHFEFVEVAWIGRCVSWLLLCVAWSQLGRALHIPTVVRPLVLLFWILLVRYGHWAGEWFVGGFEAKAIAYPLALFSLAMVIENRWSIAWLWTGAAIAFHPVVGGWIAITIMPIWIVQPNLLQRIGQQWIGILVGLSIAAIGVWPALAGFGSPDRDGDISAARIHVYFRLAHHMCPRFFDTERWLAAGFTLAMFGVVAYRWLRANTELKSQLVGSWLQRFKQLTNDSVGRIVAIALGSLAISLIGWLIDTIGFASGHNTTAAKLLRFYWFRWSDVAVPMSIAVMAGWFLTRWSFKPELFQLNDASHASTGKTLRDATLKDVTKQGSFRLSLAIVLLSGLGYLHWKNEDHDLISPADRWLLEKPGPFPVKEDTDYHSDPLPQRYRDWLAACAWIRENTPTDSLWLTPKHQQSFKWYAQRAEVVSWKDVPQDNQSIIEWYRRIEESEDPGVLSCAPPRKSDGSIRGWTTDELINLAKKYKFNWILIDRTYQDVPPLLESKYPIHIDNRNFAIFYISDFLIEGK